MDPIVVEYAELVYLIQQAGVEAPRDLVSEQFPLPASEYERNRILRVGQAAAAARDKDESLAAYVDILAWPTAVLRTTQRPPDMPERYLWHFISDDGIVQLASVGGAAFELVGMPGQAEVLDQIEVFLPLHTTRHHYSLVIDREDFLTLRELADDWSQVPAIEILVADGLDQVGAAVLFDAAASPQWRATVEYLVWDGDTIAERETVRVGQGQALALLGTPYETDKETLRVETVLPGSFRKALEAAWETMVI